MIFIWLSMWHVHSELRSNFYRFSRKVGLWKKSWSIQKSSLTACGVCFYHKIADFDSVGLELLVFDVFRAVLVILLIYRMQTKAFLGSCRIRYAKSSQNLSNTMYLRGTNLSCSNKMEVPYKNRLGKLTLVCDGKSNGRKTVEKKSHDNRKGYRIWKEMVITSTWQLWYIT